MTNKRSITARLAPTRKAKLEALADAYYQGAQADVIRRWIDEQYDLVFGDLDPRGLLDGRVDDDTAHTLMGDTQTDTDDLLEALDVDDELRLEEDEQLPATAQDGGTLTHQPERFETMLGPQELATSGPALEWEELREIVADDGHWSETLVIHPDRVPENVLKSNHKLASRVLAAMARHEAHDGLIPEGVIDDLIETYASHLHNRADEAAGARYIRETYEPLLREHLWYHPNPKTGAAWATREKHAASLENTIDDPWGTLHEQLDTETLFDPDRYRERLELSTWDERQWHADVADWLVDVARLQEIQLAGCTERVIDPGELAVTVPEQYADVRLWLLKTVQQLLERFVQEVPESHREAVLTHHASTAVEETIRPLIE